MNSEKEIKNNKTTNIDLKKKINIVKQKSDALRFHRDTYQLDDYDRR